MCVRLVECGVPTLHLICDNYLFVLVQRNKKSSRLSKGL